MRAARQGARRPRVVFVTRRYGEPGATAVRLRAYVRAVHAAGFEVDVVTRFPFLECRAQRARAFRRCWLQREMAADSHVVRLRLPAEERLEAALDRLLAGWGRRRRQAPILGLEAIDFLFACVALPWVLARRPRVVVLEQGPVWLALPLRLAAAGGTALVLQISDVKSAALAHGQYGVAAEGQVRRLARLEARAWAAAARLVTVTERLRQIVAERTGWPAGRIELIPNGVELDQIVPADAATRARRKQALGLTGRFVVLYAGTLGAAHDLPTLIRAAALLESGEARGAVAVLVVGDGEERPALARLIAELGLDGVRLLPGVPLAELGAYLGAADLGVSTERRGLRDTVRAKLFLYMGAGLPIVASDDGGEVRELLARAAAGLVVEPENPAALAAGIRRLRDEPGLAARCAEAGRRYAQAHHDRRVLAARFAAVVRAAAERA